MKIVLTAVLVAFGSMAVTAVAELPAPLAISLGASGDPAVGVSYSISASGKPEENRQEVQFRAERKKQGGEESTTLTLRTGKQKTVAQVLKLAEGVFQKFLAGQPPATVLGKLGSIEKGGEVEFVAESADVLRFDFKSPETEVVSARLSRSDVSAFLAILQGK